MLTSRAWPGLAAGIGIAALAAAMSVAPAAGADSAAPSAITTIEIRSDEPAGTFGGVPYHRLTGVLRGTVSTGEDVAGIAQVAKGRPAFPYETTFELVAPVDPAKADGVVVEPTNRGTALLTRDAPAQGAPRRGTGNGYLFDRGAAVAHIQWQTGIAAGVPEAAQGVGEVIVRDFGRLLGGAFGPARGSLPVFPRRILAGISQSAFFVNTVLAEGFNTDPATGAAVYKGIFTRNGNGLVLAINRHAAGGRQFPYLAEAGLPLTPQRLFARSKADIVAVDLSSLTDYYRLRAGTFAKAPGDPRLHRYATAAPHAPVPGPAPAGVFGALGCNGGREIALDPVKDAYVVRALIAGLAQAIGIGGGTGAPLPADAPFGLVAAAPDLGDIVRVAGEPAWVPAIGADGRIAGGVGLPDAVAPLGMPAPPAVPPVKMGSIRETCGNFAGWRRLSAAELRSRYGTRAAYLTAARTAADKLVAARLMLAGDVDASLADIAAQLPRDFE